MGFHKDLIGTDLHAPTNEIVENNTGSTIAGFKAVKFNGVGTAYPQIQLANGGTDSVKGITQASIATASSGYICAQGLLTNVDTSSFLVNDTLYADASGNLSTTSNGRPLAQVMKVNATLGIVYVYPPATFSPPLPGHASTHLPNGSDPLTTGAASTLTPDLSSATGTANAFARQDHIHNVPADVAVSLSATTTNTEGTGSSFARNDHTHAISSGAPSTQTPDQANATGSSANFARADHIHQIATAAASSLNTSSTNTQGSSSSFARADHTHAVSLINSRVASTTLITTTSTSYVVMTGMTLTPAAGTYYVLARSTVSATSNNRTINLAIYSNGTIASDSEIQTFIRTGSGFLTSTDIQNMNTCAIVTVNGSQAIDLRWYTSGGTAQAQGYAITVIKLNN